MKKVRKLFAAILCICLIVSVSVTVLAVQPRIIVGRCEKCPNGQLSQTTTRHYEHDERLPCTHGNSSAMDLYGAYEVTVSGGCDSCSYRYSRTYTDHVLKKCNGV